MHRREVDPLLTLLSKNLMPQGKEGLLLHLCLLLQSELMAWNTGLCLFQSCSYENMEMNYQSIYISEYNQNAKNDVQQCKTMCFYVFTCFFIGVSSWISLDRSTGVDHWLFFVEVYVNKQKSSQIGSENEAKRAIRKSWNLLLCYLPYVFRDSRV